MKYQKSIDDLVESVKRIRKHAEQTSEKSGTVECLTCGGKLNYAIAHNGHIWAKCETPECLHIMQ